MRLDEHCKHCEEVLGEEFREVHVWLDELFRYFGGNHRPYRHCDAGVKEVYKRWGRKAAEAAILHIRDDMEYCRNLDDILDPEAYFPPMKQWRKDEDKFNKVGSLWVPKDEKNK